jgi:KDO2-lipid IV(A) lauroyltransferase
MESSLEPKRRLAGAFIFWLARAWGLLPVGLAQRVGSVFGLLVDLVPNREREVATVNLAACYPAKAPAERQRLRRDNLIELGRLFAEMPAAWFKPPGYWDRRIDSRDFEAHARLLLAAGKGMIVAAPHLGNWEISLIACARARLGAIIAMYRPPRQPALEPVLMAGREKGGAKLVPATAGGVRAVHAALRRGYLVGILPDQSPKIVDGRGAGVFAPFFGIPAFTMTLVSRLARRSGAPVVFIFAERLPRGRFRIRWCDAPAGIDGDDPVLAATALNAGVEQCVRLRPEQYLWSYKRFAPAPRGGRSLYARKRKARP